MLKLNSVYCFLIEMFSDVLEVLDSFFEMIAIVSKCTLESIFFRKIGPFCNSNFQKK